MATSAYLLTIGLLRFITCFNRPKALADWLMMLTPIALGFLILVLGADIGLYYPVIISFGFFTIFYATLRTPKSFIQRIAEKIEAQPLDSFGIKYTANVTKIWCVFLLFNGGLSLFLAGHQLLDYWLLYNGLISYLLIALLFLGERLLRPYIRNKMSNSG